MSTAPDADGTRRERMVRFVESHPDTTVSGLMGKFSLGPHEIDTAKAVVEKATPGDDTDETVPDWATVGDEQDHDDELDEEDADLSRAQIQAHYREARPVYEALGGIGDHHALGVNDRKGWYSTETGSDADGFDKRGRVRRLDADFDALVGDVERTLYATTSYKPPEAFAWQPFTYEDGEKAWQDGESPTPGYGDVHALPAWGDIDLEDDEDAPRGNLKRKRREEGLSDEEREIAEDALAAYAEEYAALYGCDVDGLHLLDSVGGTFLFGPPEATLPIAGIFEDDEAALSRVMEELNERMNKWLRAAEERVNERVEGASVVLDPDWVNNKNRQYKAPLSVHGDTDAVVTPMDPADPEYTLTSFSAVESETIEEATEWAESLTSPTHTGCVASLVANLWPDYVEECDGWRDALVTWVEDKRRAEKRAEQRRQAERERREERREALGGRVADADVTVTPFIQDVYDALDDVPIADVVKNYASDGWDTGRSTSAITEFNPSWRQSSSGSSCFVDESEGTFGDPGEGGGGYVAKAMALGEGIIDGPTGDLDGDEWRDAVSKLRAAGYEIPLWIPERGSLDGSGEEYDQMPYWALRKAALALDAVPETLLVEKEGEDGSTYLGFPGPKTYNMALDAVEEAGLDHGRERADTKREEEKREKLAKRAEVLSEQADEDDEAAAKKMLIEQKLGEAS